MSVTAPRARMRCGVQRGGRRPGVAGWGSSCGACGSSVRGDGVEVRESGCRLRPGMGELRVVFLALVGTDRARRDLIAHVSYRGVVRAGAQVRALTARADA